jgi:hypothetical protein
MNPTPIESNNTNDSKIHPRKILLFTPPKELTYLEDKLDLHDYLSINKFLEVIDRYEQPITGNYSQDISSMCEYFVYWAAHQLIDKKLDGKLFVAEGYFGFADHNWLYYSVKDKDKTSKKLFIDFTLAQFIKDAPKFAIVDSKESSDETTYRGYHMTPYKEWFNNKLEYCKNYYGY